MRRKHFQEIIGSAGIVLYESRLRIKRIIKDDSIYYFAKIAKDVLLTLELFDKYNKNGYFVYDEKYEYDVMISFKLDLRVDFKIDQWNKWLSIIEKLNLITLEGNIIYPSKLLYTENDIIDLKNIIKEVYMNEYARDRT